MMNLLSCCRRGISLVEVMAASAVLVIGMGATFSSMSVAEQSRQRAEDHNAALVAIQSQVEVLQAMDTTALDGRFGSSSSYTFPVTGLVAPGSTGRGEAGIVEKLAPTTNSYGCTILRLRCDWRNATGDDHVELIYFYTRRKYEGE